MARHRFSTYSRPAPSAIRRASADAMPSWSHVDQSDLLADLGQGPVGLLAEQPPAAQVDRDDPPAVALHRRRHPVRGLGRVGARAHYGDDVVAGEDLLDDEIGVCHAGNATCTLFNKSRKSLSKGSF
jgi:hypothetical protein